MIRPILLLTLLATAGLAESRLPPPMATVGFAAPFLQVGDGTGEVQVAVALNHAATAPVTVTYRTVDGSAVQGVDYRAAAGELTFAPGQVLATFPVDVRYTRSPSSRTVNLQLVSASGAATLGADALAVLNIRGGAGSPPAALLAPAPGSRLPAGQARFVWSSARARGFWLKLGTRPGAADLYDRAVWAFRMVDAKGLPADGRTVYAQLWTQSQSGWDVFATAYEAAGAPVLRQPEGPVPPAPLPNAAQQTAQPAALPAGRTVRPSWLMPAAMLSPAPGSQLPAGAVTFTWESAAWAKGYTLEVLSGSTVIASRDAGTALSAAVSGLPADGRALTVRLTTRFAGTSMDSQASYTAASSTYSAAQLHNLARINYYRGLKGALALQLDAQLTAFAQAGSAQLSVDHLPHQHFINASNAGTLWTTGGFRSSAAENQGDPNGWTQLSSDPTQNTTLQIDAIMLAMFNEGPGGGHYENMVATRFTRVGIGLVTVSGKLYLTNDFSQ